MILLDTHVLLWTALQPSRLSRAASNAIARAEARDGLAIASITLWEIAQLVDLGRLRVEGSPEAFLSSLERRPGLRTLELTAEVAALAFRFPATFSKDPADRIIAATARVHALPLVTKDAVIQECRLVRTIW